ncbi:acyltransferase family protein [Bradyrhizobium sp. USDA 10063]
MILEREAESDDDIWNGWQRSHRCVTQGLRSRGRTGTMSGKIVFADRLRGIAALCVVVSHYLSTFWTKQEYIPPVTGLPELHAAIPIYVQWLQIPYFNWGGFGVAVFFLISGFVIPFSFANYRRADFLIARVLRLYPTYLIGLSITLATVAAANWIIGTPFPHAAGEVLIAYLLGVRDFLWVKNLDGIVWTLEIELKFYVVCAVIGPWLRDGSLKVFAVPVLLFAIALFLGNYLPISPSIHLNTVALSSPFLAFMFIGVAFNYYHRNLLDARNTLTLVLALLTAFAVAEFYGMFKLREHIPSYCLAVFLFALAMKHSKLIARVPTLPFWSRISYPLYVVHGVAGYALMTVMLAYGIRAWLCIIVAFSAATLCSLALHYLIEAPTHKLGKTFAARIRGRPFAEDASLANGDTIQVEQARV